MSKRKTAVQAILVALALGQGSLVQADAPAADAQAVEPALAAGSEPAAGAAEIPTMQQIVVQARRRDERLLDAPLSITVETGPQLQEQNAVLVEDVAREVPNLRMMPSPQSVSALDVTMRGQTSIRAAIDYDPAVGIYVDGVYVANGQAAMGTLLDIDKVEISRGAQGTLFGRDNTGGAISFQTRRPQLGVTSAELAADAGADGLFMGRGILNIPAGDTLAFRVAYQDNEREGFGSSLATGQGDFENQHRFQVRLGALWKPNQGFDAFWTYEHFEANEAGALLHPLAGPAPGTGVYQLAQAIPLVGQVEPALVAGIAPVIFPTNPYQTDADLPSHDDTGLDSTQLTLTQALDATTRAKLILAYRHLHNNTAIDVDATSLPIADTYLTNTSGQKSAEFQLSGLSFERRLDWVGGLYWFRDDGGAPSLVPAQPVAYQTLFAGIDSLLGAQGGAPVNPYPVVGSNSVENISSAAFLHGDYKVTDRWAVAAGVRRTDDVRKLSENDYFIGPAGDSCTIVDASTQLPLNYPNLSPPCPPIDKSVSFSYWSWEFSTTYRVTDEVNTYLRTGRGQRSGGWNIPINTFQALPFRPEELTDYEWGVKADPFGGAWVTAADLFYGNYDEMQRLLPLVVGGTPTTYVVNAGRARVSGSEVDSYLHLSRSWSMHGAFGWTDARYRQFLYVPPTGGPTVDLSGNEFYQTPKFNAALGVGYETALARGRLQGYVDYAWQDEVQFNVINDFNNQGAYGTLDARLGYDIDEHGNWEVALFGSNLTGREYAITGGTVSSGVGVAAMAWQIPGTPRIYGIELRYRFESRH